MSYRTHVIIRQTTCDRIETQSVVCQLTGGFLFGTINPRPGEFQLSQASWTDLDGKYYFVYLRSQGENLYHLFDSVGGSFRVVGQLNAPLT